MTNDIKQLVSTCQDCTCVLPSQSANPMTTPSPSTHFGFPMQYIGLDLFSYANKDYLCLQSRANSVLHQSSYSPSSSQSSTSPTSWHPSVSSTTVRTSSMRSGTNNLLRSTSQNMDTQDNVRPRSPSSTSRMTPSSPLRITSQMNPAKCRRINLTMAFPWSTSIGPVSIRASPPFSPSCWQASLLPGAVISGPAAANPVLVTPCLPLPATSDLLSTHSPVPTPALLPTPLRPSRQQGLLPTPSPATRLLPHLPLVDSRVVLLPMSVNPPSPSTMLSLLAPLP